MRLLFLLLLVGSGSSWAVQPFEQAVLLQSVERNVPNYSLSLGPSRRELGRLFSDREHIISGHLTRQTWRLPNHVDFRRAQQVYQQQLTDQVRLFQCVGSACGENRYWATQVFNNSVLTGRDYEQMVSVSLLTLASGEQQITVIYLVERATRDVMVNVDVVRTRDRIEGAQLTSAQVTETLLSEQGWLPGLMVVDNELQQEQSQVLIRALQNLTTAQAATLHLAVMCYSYADMAENLACSQRLAQQLTEQLERDDLTVTGLGAYWLPSAEQTAALRFVRWPRK